MKKILFILLAAGILFTGCGPADENGGDEETDDILTVIDAYLTSTRDGTPASNNKISGTGNEWFAYIYFEDTGLGNNYSFSITYTTTGNLTLRQQAAYDATGTWGWGTGGIASGRVWNLTGGQRWGSGESLLDLSTIRGICIGISGTGDFTLNSVRLHTDPDFNPNQIKMPSASSADGFVFSASGGDITLSSETSGAEIFYTTDRSAPTRESAKYSDPISITQNTFIRAIAVKDEMDDSQILDARYTVVKSDEAMNYAASMKIGWNLGNTLEAHNGSLMPSETAWGNPAATQSLMTVVKNNGFEAVRIPVTWGQKLHSGLRNNPGSINLTVEQINNLTIDQAWLNRVAQVVEYARVAGLKAIINIHHDGADSHHWLSVKNEDIIGENKLKVDAIFAVLWNQIAEKFKEQGDFLIFEGFNELHDGNWGNGNDDQRSRVNELNQIFVDTVRATGGNNANRYLVVSGWVTRPSLMRHIVIPYDTVHDRLIANFHYYDPYDFSGSAQASAWGSKAVPNGWANETHVRNQFNAVKALFTDKGIPVMIGEYGAVNQSTVSGREHRRYYMEYVTKHAADCGFIPFYWDNGGEGAGSEKFGLIKRTSPHSLINDGQNILDAMLRAVNSDYSLSDIIVP